VQGESFSNIKLYSPSSTVKLTSPSILLTSFSSPKAALTRTHANIKFRLHSGTTPLNNATISLGEDSLITNALGIATFQQVPVNQTYNYLVKNEGYFDVEGEVVITSDTTIEIEMIELSTFVRNNFNNYSFRFWPNPAHDRLHISCTSAGQEITISIINIKGQKVLEKNIVMKDPELDIGFLEKGIYFLHYSSREENDVFLLVKTH
jgi:hypothetical protein